ncbi:MAG: ribonuclease P protein component [Acidimicrobiales bacterium]
MSPVPASPGTVWRVSSRSSFDQLRRQGRRVRRGPLSVTFLPAGVDGPPRVAYAIGRRVGGAVVRNRLRRRLRAVVAELAPGMSPGVYLVSASAPAVALGYGELRSLLSRAVSMAADPR